MSVRSYEVQALRPPAWLKMTADRASRPSFDMSRLDKFAGDLIVSLALVAATYIAALGLHYGLDFERLPALLLAPICVAAALYGVRCGVVAAVVCIGLLGRLMPLTPEPLQLGPTQSLPLLTFYLTGALAAGLYARTRRLRRQAADAEAKTAAVGRQLGLSRDSPLRAREAQLVAGLLASAASVGMVVTGGGVAVLAGGSWTLGLLPLLLMAPVLAAGATYGVAAGLLAGAAAALFSTFGAGAAPEPFAALQAFLLYGGAGVAVGLFADRVRRDRGTLQRLRQAADELSQAKAESEIWEAVADAAGDIAGRHVRLSDEAGRTLQAGGGEASVQSIGPDPRTGVSRARQLTVDGGSFGSLAWDARHVRRDDQRAIDQALSVLADLGASAAMRSKLGAEKSEMEFVARTEQLRTILLDAVSHHFRTPLSSIIGSVTNLLEHAEQHDVRASHEFLLIIKEQANRLDRYVENFLGVARLESGSIEFNPRAMDLEPLVNDVWESFGESGGARRFLDVQIEDRAILSDPGPLKQVLGNLLENAIKFSEEETIVTVTGRAVGTHMVLEVTDQGDGVPPADLQRIFGRFFRSREAKASGLGLGLYITKSLVELMGGAIEAANRTDGVSGLTMRVTLPLAGT